MELRLIVEFDRRRYVEWEVGGLRRRCGAAETLYSVDLGFDLLVRVSGLGVRVGGHTLEIAVDVAVIDRRLDIVNRGLVGLSVLLGSFLTEVLDEMPIDETV